jgi:hypothetical protein
MLEVYNTTIELFIPKSGGLEWMKNDIGMIFTENE